MSATLINWDDSFSVNISNIDKQHKRIVDLINNLYGSMKDGAGNQIIGNILSALVDYTVTHFTFEEKMMEENSYPELPIHKEEHEKLIEKVQGLQDEFLKGKALTSTELMDFLQVWLTEHIKGIDMKYKPFLNEKGII